MKSPSLYPEPRQVSSEIPSLEFEFLAAENDPFKKAYIAMTTLTGRLRGSGYFAIGFVYV